MPDTTPHTDCIERGTTPCHGTVEPRMSLSGSGMPFSRCDRHWNDRLDREEEVRRRYPQRQPADFDPTYAGERWDED
ncbi:hypothetical protein HQ602_17280 [Rhodococcus kroppenstedtii]|uniref:hypothetical protein n=1 Tax=Rhodococcoides kroppenstedtii TaxID=293050 RepID=UPI001C9B96EE|nr:hypothetical protein [Rhodococcus kroppenstedtii]MBY6438129.1 hypothetical protein [Rhodococcus kroppenstedtii]